MALKPIEIAGIFIVLCIVSLLVSFLMKGSSKKSSERYVICNGKDMYRVVNGHGYLLNPDTYVAIGTPTLEKLTTDQCNALIKTFTGSNTMTVKLPIETIQPVTSGTQVQPVLATNGTTTNSPM